MKAARVVHGVVPATVALGLACDADSVSEPAELEMIEPGPEALKAIEGPELESHIQTVPFTTFEDDVGDAGQDETIRVITSAFGYHVSFGNAPPADLQFDREWVLFYSGGLQPTGGYQASVDRLLNVPYYALLYADVRLQEPGPQCVVPQAITKPHVLARFPIPSPRPYYFSSEIAHEVVDCEPPPEPIVLDFEFEGGAQQWSAHFADLPQNFDPDLYDLTAEIASLPSELGTSTGFLLGGSNRSDDLWMGLERQVGSAQAIEANRAYVLEYEIQFGSNAPTGCAGIGGPPGESVYQKAGAAAVDPEPVVSSDGHLRLNIDKGNQALGGSNASVVDDIANGIPCEDSDGSYVSLTRTHRHPEPITADQDGNLWLVVGTDSGFEGRTELYYQRITVTLTPQ